MAFNHVCTWCNQPIKNNRVSNANGHEVYHPICWDNLQESKKLKESNQVPDRSQLLDSIIESQQRQYGIIQRKNSDYSPGAEEYRNFTVVNQIMPWITTEEGIIIRMLDKLMRLANLAHYGKAYVTEEKFEDTCDDLSNYSNILIAYRQNKITAQEAKELVDEMEKTRAYAQQG